MKRQNIRTLSLVVITLTYLIVGAAVFDYFESANEERENELLNRNITRFKTKYKMNDTSFNILWHKILEKKPYQAGHQWRFIGSLYFCTVVVTLIGYGHSTPRTIPGKCFCIIYTLIGIPIALIMFQSVGERLNSLIAYVLGKIKKRLNLKNQDVGLVELITVESVLTMTITCFASYVFMRNEGWSYFDAMYYCFITLTTIGFGDMVPMQKDNALSSNFAYACFTILFILTGLITLASSMNLLVLRLATINAEEQVQEKLEAAEARRQAVHLEGDVISPNGRLFVKEEKPEQVETISVCSCACLDYKIWECKRNRRKKGKRHSQQRHHPQCTSASCAMATTSMSTTSSLRNRRPSSSSKPMLKTKNEKSANPKASASNSSSPNINNRIRIQSNNSTVGVSDVYYCHESTTRGAELTTITSFDNYAEENGGGAKGGGGGFFLNKLKPLKRLMGSKRQRESEMSSKYTSKKLSMLANNKNPASECIELTTKSKANDFFSTSGESTNLENKTTTSSASAAPANANKQLVSKQSSTIVRRHTTINTQEKLTNKLSNDSGYTNTNDDTKERGESPNNLLRQQQQQQQQQIDDSFVDYEDDRQFYKRNSI